MVPFYQSYRFYQRNEIDALRPNPKEPNPKDSVASFKFSVAASWASLSFQYLQLMPKRDDLKLQRYAPPKN
jgi:hypothetical protein